MQQAELPDERYERTEYGEECELRRAAIDEDRERRENERQNEEDQNIACAVRYVADEFREADNLYFDVLIFVAVANSCFELVCEIEIVELFACDGVDFLQFGHDECGAMVVGDQETFVLSVQRSIPDRRHIVAGDVLYRDAVWNNG